MSFYAMWLILFGQWLPSYKQQAPEQDQEE